jgi:hypothetical protein
VAWLETRTTAVVGPSARLRRSSPKRAWSGPNASPPIRWTNVRTARNPSSSARSPEATAGDLQWGRPRACAGEPAGRQDGVEEREPKGGLDRLRPQVALDPLEDPRETEELPIGVEVEQVVDERAGVVGNGEALAEGTTDGGDGRLRGPRPLDVLVVDRRVPNLATALLVAADGASVVLVRREWLPVVGSGLPRQLVGDQRAPAGRAAGREQRADRQAEAGLPFR